MNRFILLLILAGLLFSACKENKKDPFVISRKETLASNQPGECPYLTKDTKGNTILSWVRLNNDSTTSFCYAKMKNENEFDDLLVIPNSGNIEPHGENLPKIIFKPSGEIIALWGVASPNPKNKYSGLVFYVQSFDEGKTWTKPKPLVSDTTSYDQRYYDVALLPGGEAGIIWLDNRKTISLEGSALYFAVTDKNNGFAPGKLISQPCCQCCRTDLFVDSKGSIHAIYRGIIEDSIRDMLHIVSTDQGQNFSAPARISKDNWVITGCPHTGPAMTENNEGLQFAWFTGGRNPGCFFTSSKDNGASFAPRSAISELGSHPQLASFTNNDILIVWDEAVRTNDKYYKRIGVQKRNAGNNAFTKNFITPDTATSTFPVISPTGINSAVIAYTTRKGNKDYVAYQVIKCQ